MTDPATGTLSGTDDTHTTVTWPSSPALLTGLSAVLADSDEFRNDLLELIDTLEDGEFTAAAALNGLRGLHLQARGILNGLAGLCDGVRRKVRDTAKPIEF